MPIHPSAQVHPSAKLHESVVIGPNALVLENVELGEGCEVMNGAVVGPNVRMGKRNKIHFHAVIGHDAQHLAFDPKIGSGVVAGDDNTFRELCTVHRAIADGQNTVFGNGNFVMASAHVAHDCVIGNNVIIASFAGLAGHVTVGDRTFVSGPSGVHQWVRIGRLAMVSGITGVGKDVPPFMIVKERGILSGLNVVGLRRAGIPADTRHALKSAYRELFRSGRPLSLAIAAYRAQWEGRAMPPEVVELLDFCSDKSRRGICRGPRVLRGTTADDLEDGDDG